MYALLQQIKVIHSGAEGLVLRYAVKLLFAFFAGEQRFEAVALVILYRVFRVDGINQQESAAGFVVGSVEPRLDEVHNLLAYPILRALIIDIYAYSANQNGRIGAPSLGKWNVAVNLSTRVVLQVGGLNTGIGKSYHTHALGAVLSHQPTISLAHEFFLIGKSFVVEEVVKICITA